MLRPALLALLAIVPATGCILVVEVEGQAELTVANRSVADRLEIELMPIDDDGLCSGATFDAGEQVTLAATVGLYDLALIDTAGEPCVIRQFAFALGDHDSFDVFDHDLVECAARLPPGFELPDPWE
jgi:hypothetical protein